jgi:hypothetical protein
MYSLKTVQNYLVTDSNLNFLKEVFTKQSMVLDKEW